MMLVLWFLVWDLCLAHLFSGHPQQQRHQLLHACLLVFSLRALLELCCPWPDRMHRLQAHSLLQRQLFLLQRQQQQPPLGRAIRACRCASQQRHRQQQRRHRRRGAPRLSVAASA